jgi:hypothetical protein
MEICRARTPAGCAQTGSDFTVEGDVRRQTAVQRAGISGWSAWQAGPCYVSAALTVSGMRTDD